MNRSERGSATQQQASSMPNSTSSSSTSSSSAAGSITTPYRSLSYKYKRYHHHHHHHRRHRNNQWWRNPCIIFFISFAALGTLRFRVPARSRKAASQLILKQREKRAAKKQQKRESLLGISPIVTDRAATDDSPAGEHKISMNTAENTTSASVIYTLMEEERNGSQGSFQKYRALLRNDQRPVSVQVWAELLSQTTSDSDPVLAGLLRTIRSAPYKAVFFETPPVTSGTLKQQTMEFVLMDAPKLHTAASEHPDPHAFAQQFLQQNSHTNVVAFENLGGDARLIAPKPPPAIEKKKSEKMLRRYAHLSNFCREAPAEQVAAVWRLAAQEYLQRVQQQQSRPVWFSTSGLGIYWLHFRLDSVPKYYTYLPYKQQPEL